MKRKKHAYEASAVKWQRVAVPATPSVPAWLTVENVAWLGLLLAAFFLRFLLLGGKPLSLHEARLAWPAYAVAHAKTLFSTVGVSPALFTGQWVLFSVFHGSAFLARFWPALAGACLIVIPYRLRHRLGREAALLTGLLLLFSAHQVWLSRNGDGAMIAEVAALWLFVDLLEIAEGKPSRFWTAALTLAVLLLAAPESYTLLIVISVAVVPLATRIGQQWKSAEASARHKTMIAFFVTFFLLGTLFLTRLTLLGAAWEQLAAWVRRFAVPAGYPLYWLPLRIFLDEPLLTVAGLFALPGAVRHWREPWTRFLLAWGALFLLAGFLPGHSSRETAFLVVPPAFWAGQQLWLAWQHWLSDCPCRSDSVYGIGFSVILLGTAAIVTSMLAQDSMRSILPLLLLPVILLAVLDVLQGFWFSWRAAIQQLLILALLVGGGLTLATTWRDNWDQMAWVEPAFTKETINVDATHFVPVLAQASAERVGDAHELPVIVAVSDDLRPFVLWQLRDFRYVTAVAALPKQFTNEAVVTGVDVKDLPGHFGGKFILTQKALPDGPPLLWMQWLLYRLDEQIIPAQRIILWLQPFAAATGK